MELLRRIFRQSDIELDEAEQQKIDALGQERERVERMVEAYEERVEIARSLRERDQPYRPYH